MNLEVDICGIKLKNPVIGASGTVGFGVEFKDYIDLNKIGGISTKGLTLNPREGNTGIRIYETPAGMMNSIGLQNPGIKSFIENEYHEMKKYEFEIIANIGGSQIEDYLESVRLINQTDIRIIELNISCPNVKEGGMAFGIKCDTAYEIVRQVRAATDKILMVKLSPNAENIKDMAKTCVKAGADCLSLVNTFNASAVDVYKRRAVFDNITAGLSGAAVKPIALRMVRDVCSVVNVPVIAMGGIMNAIDAIEFIMVGATAVQVGGANFINPCVMEEIVEGIERFCEEQGIKNLNEIRGVIK